MYTTVSKRINFYTPLNVLSQSREEIAVSNTYMYRRCLECQVTKISINMFN